MLSSSWMDALGPFPDKVPLAAEILDEVDCGHFIRRKVSYAVERDERISAFLCLPKAPSGMLPAVFCHHQHGGNWALGKSEPVGIAGSQDQFYAKELAALGHVTLTPDLPYFEERADAKDPFGYHSFGLATRLVQGRTLLAKVLHEVGLGIDYLQGLPMVDPDRIGFIGHSYGGRTAIVAAAHDQRIKASVSSCGSTTYRDMIHHRTGIQLDFVVPGILGIGDLDDLLAFIEPNSLLVIGASQDRWSMGIEDMIEKGRRFFREGELLGKLFEGKHSFPDEMRTTAYEFLSRHLRR
jgi:dienelactone hydrolase